jgi:DNA-binding NarL/FixJ family response regulator
MPGRRDIRAVCAIDVVESAYRLDGTEAEWLDRVLARARADLDTGPGVYAFTSAGDTPNIESSPVFVQQELDGEFGKRLADLDREGAAPAYQRIRSRLVSCGGLEQFFGATSDVVVTYRSLMQPTNIDDGFFLFAQDAEGTSVNLAAPSRNVVTPPPRVRGIWSKVGLHVASALRLRRKLAAKGSTRDALLDPSGRVHDAGEALKDDHNAKSVLSRAVQEMEHARSAGVRAAPEHALALWQGLVAGEWSLVEHWEREGRRYVAAYRNRPELRDPRALTQTERSLLKHLALGATNKEIAYALGLPAATVSTSVTRVLKKFRLRSRVDLAVLLAPERLSRLDLGLGDQLAVLAVDTLPRGPVADTLSSAELEVASYVTRGWSNARIAEERGVSPRTVANQLRTIFDKLDITSRSQLARLVSTSPNTKLG